MSNELRSLLLALSALVLACQTPVTKIYRGPDQPLDRVAVLHTGFEEVRGAQRARVIVGYVDGVMIDYEVDELVAVLPGAHTVEIHYSRWRGDARMKPRRFVTADDPDAGFILSGGDSFVENNDLLAETRYALRFDVSLEAGATYRITADELREPQSTTGKPDAGLDLFIREEDGTWHRGSWRPRLVRIER